MSSGKVGVRLPKLGRGSSFGSGNGKHEMKTKDKDKERGEKRTKDKDSNSLHNTNSDTGADSGSSCGRGSDPGNGNESSVGNVDVNTKEAGGVLNESSVVYLGGGTGIVVPHTGASKTNNTNENNLQFRRCCFFWTCCCRCSCLNVRHNNTEPNPGRLDPLNVENEPIPTIEDIREWGDSFDRLMKWSVGRKAFREFLKCEYSDENILFWQACEELKREKDPTLIEEKARVIYEDYVSILSPKEVSLDSRVREVINKNMVEPSPHTFDEAQTQIYTLMHRDSYPRFINSVHYKRLAQLNNNGSGGSLRKESGAS